MNTLAVPSIAQKFHPLIVRRGPPGPFARDITVRARKGLKFSVIEVISANAAILEDLTAAQALALGEALIAASRYVATNAAAAVQP